MKRSMQLIITAASIVLIVYKIDFTVVWESLASANYWYLFAAFLVVIVNRCLMGYKWNLLLQAVGINMSHFESIKIYFISNFLGLFLPPTVGMDSIRAFMVKKRNHSFFDTVSSIFVERLLGLMVILLYGVFGVIIFLLSVANIDIELVNLLIISMIMLFVFFIVFMLSLNETVYRWKMKFFNHLMSVNFLDKIMKIIIKIYDSYYQFRHKKMVLFVFSLLTILEATLVTIWVFCISESLGAGIPLYCYWSIVPVITIITRIPITIASIGIHEGSYIYFLSLLGYSKSLGFSIGMIDHLVIILGILPGALFLLSDKIMNRNYREVLTENE